MGFMIAAKSLMAGMMFIGLVGAGEKSQAKGSLPKSETKSEGGIATREAYDELFNDILKSLPREARSKVDSVRDMEPKAVSKAAAKSGNSPEDMKKKALDTRKKDMDELPASVRDKVDKALQRLEKKKEKKSDFKELKG